MIRWILLILMSVVYSFAGQWLQGRVVKVSDGDTFHMLVDGKNLKIRLNAVDCPESKQAYGPAATHAADSLLYGKVVRVEVTDTDRYGRLVGEVWIGELDLNKWLVQHGLAWWYTHYAPKRQDLADAEKQARRERIGLWADSGPMPPWDFRKAAREHNKGHPY